MPTSSSGFASAIKAWTSETHDKVETVFKLSFQMTADAVRQMTPATDGFLSDSLTVTIGDIAKVDPKATGENGAALPASHDIADARLGHTLSAGFVAAHAHRVEYGGGGQPAQAMVRLGVQRFPEFVEAAVKRAHGS